MVFMLPPETYHSSGDIFFSRGCFQYLSLSTRYSVRLYAKFLDLGDFWRKFAKVCRVYDILGDHETYDTDYVAQLP